jgi:hypothetical protein
VAKKSFVRKTQRTIVGAAKSGAARVRKIAIKAATAAATAAAEAAVEAVMKSTPEGQMRGRSTTAKRPVRTTRRTQARKKSPASFNASSRSEDVDPASRGRSHRRHLLARHTVAEICVLVQHGGTELMHA